MKVMTCGKWCHWLGPISQIETTFSRLHEFPKKCWYMCKHFWKLIIIFFKPATPEIEILKFVSKVKKINKRMFVWMWWPVGSDVTWLDPFYKLKLLLPGYVFQKKFWYMCKQFWKLISIFFKPATQKIEILKFVSKVKKINKGCLYEFDDLWEVMSLGWTHFTNWNYFY